MEEDVSVDWVVNTYNSPDRLLYNKSKYFKCVLCGGQFNTFQMTEEQERHLFMSKDIGDIYTAISLGIITPADDYGGHDSISARQHGGIAVFTSTGNYGSQVIDSMMVGDKKLAFLVHDSCLALNMLKGNVWQGEIQPKES